MTTTRPTTSLVVAFSRVFWMLLGPMLLALLVFSIVNDGSGWFTAVDFAFLGLLGVLLLARWFEFRGGNPRTATGAQATAAHLRRYALGATAAGFGAWIVANLVGNHWLNR